MASMRDIRMRIKSVNETKQITKAMKLISASKLKKAREQFEITSPFFDKIQSTLKFILAHTKNEEYLSYFDKREKVAEKKVGFLIITGDKGMCGGYNSNVIKLAQREMKKYSPENIKLFMIGNVGKLDFHRKGFNIDSDFNYAVQNPNYHRVRDITNHIIEQYNLKQLDEVYLIFTEMITSLRLEPQVMKLLPLESVDFEQSSEEYEATKYLLNFEFNPSMRVVFDRLVPQYLRGIVYGALVESYTSEQSARMTAMDSATRNADELIKKLTLFYNRARQSMITQEISEIIGGSETIKS